MKKQILFTLFMTTLLSGSINAQISANYEVATWHEFKTAAVSYTFDDNCSKQIPVALPLFDNYGYKVTIFAVTNWGPNWNSLKTVSGNGHEVASHTVSHPSSLATLSLSNQETELKNSQSTIISNVPTTKCQTIAYPNCNTGDINTIKKYYIAGRTCSNQIISSSPNDFYNLSSNFAGAEGIVKTANDFNNKASSAKSSKGWCVFLLHGIDDDGGYSATQSSVLKSHLAYMNTNKADYWIGTFANVVKYIKERNALSLTEATINTDSLQLTAADNLDNATYNVPITVRRALPTTWQNAKVYAGNKLIASSVSTINSKKYVTFDLVPDEATIYLSNPNKLTTGEKQNFAAEQSSSAEPNPFTDYITLKAKEPFTYHILSLEGSLLENGSGSNAMNVGVSLAQGVYIIRIMNEKGTATKKIVKK